METLILCEHNWSFVKLRSVHAQIVRKYVCHAHYQFFTDSLNVYYLQVIKCFVRAIRD